MPYPDNLEVARKCESIVRENGAVPATIAIIKGQIILGTHQGFGIILSVKEKVLLKYQEETYQSLQVKICGVQQQLLLHH